MLFLVTIHHPSILPQWAEQHTVTGEREVREERRTKLLGRKENIHLWILHGFHCAVKGRSERGEADQDIHFWMLPHGISHVLINWQQDLFMTPIELLLVVTSDKNKDTQWHPKC